jgi:hypothetical protein
MRLIGSSDPCVPGQVVPLFITAAGAQVVFVPVSIEHKVSDILDMGSYTPPTIF